MKGLDMRTGAVELSLLPSSYPSCARRTGSCCPVAHISNDIAAKDVPVGNARNWGAMGLPLL